MRSAAAHPPHPAAPAAVSKTEAERAAWRLAEQHGLSLVTILPNFIMGPIIGTRADGVSFGFMKARPPGFCVFPCAREGGRQMTVFCDDYSRVSP